MAKPSSPKPSKGSRRVRRAQVLRRERQRRRSRLDEPLFPGGITTYGDFLQGRRAATEAEFRPQEEVINEAQRQIPSWYQDYLAKLQSLQAQTAEQYQGLQTQAGTLNQPVQPGSSQEAIAAGDARANIIKALQGSLIQQQGLQVGKLQQYGAIAGARKIQRQEEIGKARTDLAKAKGEFRTKYTVEAKQREFENALAAKQFGLKEEELKAETRQKRLEAKTKETTYEKEFAKQAAKYGFSPKDWQMLGPRGRARRIAEEQRRSGQRPESLRRIQEKEAIKIAARHGYSVEEWNKLSSGQRSAIIRKQGGKKKEDGGEHSFRTHAQRGTALRGAVQAKSIAQKLREGAGIPGVNKSGHKRLRPEAAKTILADPKSPEPVLVSAALDAVYDGHISSETARRLHRAGFKVEEVAEALGTLTKSKWAKSQYQKPRSWVQNMLNPK